MYAWLAENWLSPIAVGIFVGVLIPFLTATLTMIINRSLKARDDRMQASKEFLRALAAFELAVDRDTIATDNAGRSLAPGTTVFTYPEQQMAAKPGVLVAWQEIALRTNNLGLTAETQKSRDASLDRFLEAALKCARSSDRTTLRVIPTTMARWRKRGKFSFSRIDELTKSLTPR